MTEEEKAKAYEDFVAAVHENRWSCYRILEAWKKYCDLTGRKQRETVQWVDDAFNGEEDERA